ncbi:MAG: hypothetical protein IJS65_03175 [Clostridia bacterium]|nr:hypothetical protein [Clostridia bacterium]
MKKKDQQIPEENDALRDPLQGLTEEPPQKVAPAKEGDDKGRIVRIKQLEKELVRTKREDIDPDTVVSLYMPHRKRRRLGLLLLRLDKLTLGLILAAAVILLLFALAFSQEKMGNFTINLNRLELFRKGIALADDRVFTKPTARLSATALHQATNISSTFLPADLDEIDGDHNGKDYVAYTFYVRNQGKEDLGYVARLSLVNASKGAEYAARVAVWRNGEKGVYAEPAADGKPEPGCTNFEARDTVVTFKVPEFLVGYVDKYTVVIWLEGDDPECVDRIVGGSMKFNMSIDADGEDDTTLIRKFVTDVRDAVTGNREISAAGTDAPDYYLNNEITWENRRNQ